MVNLLPWRKNSPETQAVVQSSGMIGIHEQPVWPQFNALNYATDGYAGNEIVNACIRERARAGTAPVLRLVRDTPDGAEPFDHPLAELLEDPAPHTTQADFIEAFHIFLPIAGNVWMHKVRANAGNPIALHVLRPDRVTVIPSRLGVGGYSYEVDGVKYFIEAENVGHLKNPNPTNDYYGLPDLAPLAKIINIDAEITNFIKVAFKNKGVPAGWLTVKEQVHSQQQANEIRRNFWARFTGQEGWHSVGLLSGGAEYTPATDSKIVEAMTDLRHTTETRICGVLGVDPILISAEAGTVSNKFANYQEARRSLYDETVIPINNRIAQFLTRTLLPEFGLEGRGIRIEFDYGDVRALDEDETAVATRATALFTAGVITLNEARIMVGEDPLDMGGEIRRIPIAMIEEEPGTIRALPAPQAAPAPVEEEPEARSVKALSEGMERAYLQLQARTADAYASRMEELIEKQFRKQRDTAGGVIGRAAAVTGKALPIDENSILPPEADAALRDVVRGILLSLAQTVWENGDAILQTAPFSAETPAVQAMLEGSATRVTKINQTTREAIRGILKQGIDRGYSLQQIANGVPGDEFRGIKAVVEETYKNRAKTIARTEVQTAQNQTTAARYQAAGIVEVEIRDGDQDEACAAVNGTRQTVQWLAENPGAHPNCTRGALPLTGVQG